MGKAVAHPHRIHLLDLLLQGPRTVEVLAREAGIPLGSASQHLQVLRGTRLVQRSRRGTYVTYALAEGVEDFVLHLRDLGRQRLPAVEHSRTAYLGTHDAVTDRATLLARCRLGDVVLLDVRPLDEYAAGHLPGAIHSPLERLEIVARKLPVDRDIVAYCRGPYCSFAIEAARRLRDRGFRINHLDLGVPELRRLGFPVAFGH